MPAPAKDNQSTVAIANNTLEFPDFMFEVGSNGKRGRPSQIIDLRVKVNAWGRSERMLPNTGAFCLSTKGLQR